MSSARVLAAIACLALCIGSLPSGANASSREEVSLFNLINAERNARGLRTLRMSSNLNSIAGAHAARMARAEDIFHNDDLPRLVRLRWTALGENVGYAKTVRDLHHAMMSSPGHRSEILDSRFTMVGIGVAWNDGWLYAVEDFAAVRISSGPAPVRAHVAAPVRVAPRRRPPPVDRDRAAFTVRALARLMAMTR